MKTRCLAILALLLLPAVGGAHARELEQGDALESANRALEGRKAIVELKGGELYAGVSHVSVGQHVTTWEAAGEARQVATSEIQSIALEKRIRVKKWARRGLVVGGLLGAFGGGYSETDGAFLEAREASRIAKGALAGAAVGATAATIAGDRVVYEAREST